METVMLEPFAGSGKMLPLTPTCVNHAHRFSPPAHAISPRALWVSLERGGVSEIVMGRKQKATDAAILATYKERNDARTPHRSRAKDSDFHAIAGHGPAVHGSENSRQRRLGHLPSRLRPTPETKGEAMDLSELPASTQAAIRAAELATAPAKPADEAQRFAREQNAKGEKSQLAYLRTLGPAAIEVAKKDAGISGKNWKDLNADEKAMLIYQVKRNELERRCVV